MKITAIAALCTAPLALAGSLDMDLRSRGLLKQRNNIVVASESQTQTTQVGQAGAKDNANGPQQNAPLGQIAPPGQDLNGQKNNKNGNAQGNNNNQITSIQTTSSTEIIVIWVNPGNNAATTTVNSAAAATVGAAAAATHTVVVGGAQKVYTPDTIQAAVGDMVLFQFQAQNHTATQSAFADPCVALPGGMDSGFMANPNGTMNPPPQVAMAVNVSTPIWFYCKQTGHCGEGMTFSINPTANKTQADFQALAIKINGTGSAAPIVATTPPGSATSLAAAPPAASSVASAPAAATSLVSGSGTLASGGACTCQVACGAGSFPDTSIQGVAAFGGAMGAVPASGMESTS